MPRMRIITDAEQEAFDKPPVYEHRDRKRFLNLPKGLSDILATLRTPDSQIGFFLMCGYFKAARRFYIKNSIICWNDLYLARKIEKAGEYDFSDEKLKDALGILPLKSTA